MGAYTWLSDQEFKSFSSVTDDEINIALQEVRNVMPQWYISETKNIIKPFFGKKQEWTSYSVYQRTRPDGDEVRVQMSATKKLEILNLLYGLYMGYNYKLRTSQRIG